MAKKITLAILLVLILVLSLGIYIYTQKTQSDAKKAANVSAFNLIFKYGVGAKNELNTYNGTYTQDMVLDPSITTNLTLTVEEKWQILQRIDEMDLFSFPGNFSANPSGWVTPQADYYIKVQNGSQTKEVSWNDNSLMDSNIHSNLEQLASYIQSVIVQKAEYKALPTPRGGYV